MEGLCAIDPPNVIWKRRQTTALLPILYNYLDGGNYLKISVIVGILTFPPLLYYSGNNSISWGKTSVLHCCFQLDVRDKSITDIIRQQLLLYFWNESHILYSLKENCFMSFRKLVSYIIRINVNFLLPFHISFCLE